MKALSIRQPYAFAVTFGFKPVENRDWRSNNPGLKFRGPVLIHAGKHEEKDDIEGVLSMIAEQTKTDIATVAAGYRNHIGLGAIVGAATISHVVTEMDNAWFNGPYGLVMTNPKWCAPVPCKGALGFFEVPPEVMALVYCPPYHDCTRGAHG